MELAERIRDAYNNGRRKSELINQHFTYALISMNAEGTMHYDAIKECVEIDEKLGRISEPPGFLEKMAYNIGFILNFTRN